MATTRRDGFFGASEHIAHAVAALGRRPEPAFRECVKEAILAVESAAKSISGSGAAGLDAPLAELSKHVKINRALTEGFKKLYGFTSSPEGVRHALLDEASSIGFDEAKFMLVACSAFVNFLISKAAAAGLLKPGVAT